MCLCDCTVCLCMALMLHFFCDCYLQSHTPAPSHFLLSLSPFHFSPLLSHRLLPLSKQWSVTLSIQYSSPHRRAISAACLHRDSITFLLNVSYKWRNDKNKMCGLYLYKEKSKDMTKKNREQERESCHG